MIFPRAIQFIRFLVLLIPLMSCNTKKDQQSTRVAKPVIQAEFVGSQTCVSCHQQQYNDWLGSHHDQAMKVADSTSVLGDFNKVTFKGRNSTSKFFKKGDDYFVNTIGTDGEYHDYKIIYTFGVTPLQQYIVEFPNGQYQCLTTAWDSEKNKWYELYPDEEIKPGEWIHWTGGGMRWNNMCADCHSTNVQKNFDPKTEMYNTTFSEINVSCEACHGPSGLHVKFYQNPEQGKTPPKLAMNKSLSSQELVNQCARCHSRRSQITKDFKHEESFLDQYSPSLLIDPVYEQDGQIRDEDYVYGSFVQSKMYHNGVSCKDCHDVHSLKLKKTGNALCLNCHVPHYDSYAHHFHQQNTEGAQCINCHMTGRIYMGNDFRRDHSFRIPRPDQTVKYGTPNACNGCHTDKSPEWASDFIKANYGDERADHFSDHLLAGYQGDQEALSELIRQKKYPDIARATALSLYSNQPMTDRERNMLKEFLNDSSALVRNEAVSAFVKSGDRGFSKDIEPLLMDSVRLVRISAVRYFSAVNMGPENNTGFDRARKEFLNEMEMNADFASGQEQIAQHYQSLGSIDLAIKAYKKALEIDNYYNTSRMNLAQLLYEQGDIAGAEKLYLKVIGQEPEYSYSYYMLGLLYHETGKTQESLKHLAAACDREPVNIRAFYNYALKLQEVGQNEESIKIMDRALQLSPGNEELLYVKLIGQLNSGNKDAAYLTCKKLLEIAPGNPNYRQILNSLEQGGKP